MYILLVVFIFFIVRYNISEINKNKQDKSNTIFDTINDTFIDINGAIIDKNSKRETSKEKVHKNSQQKKANYSKKRKSNIKPNIDISDKKVQENLEMLFQKNDVVKTERKIQQIDDIDIYDTEKEANSEFNTDILEMRKAIIYKEILDKPISLRK